MPEELAVDVTVGFDRMGDPSIMLSLGGAQSHVLPADAAEAIALLLLRSAADSRIKGAIYRRLVLEDGWAPERALEFIKDCSS